jgi:hypothetical protein
MQSRKPFVLFLTFIMMLFLSPILALAGNIPAEGTPEWIEYTLDLDHQDHTWTYSESSDTYSLSIVPAVAYPVLPNYQGVSVAVPGAYVKGLDSEGNLIIDYKAKVVNPNGVTYTAATAPIILNTGAAGYGDQGNQMARGQRSQYGYIEVACGNRGKQSIVRDDNGKALYYTGDAPSCLVDQKNATRWVKYNIILKNIPGDINRLVSTGGSGGAAHATMFAATSNNPDFYPYEAEVGAVGVYKDAKTGKYVAKLTDGTPLSDGAWGSEGFSTISSLYEADAAQAFEYFMATEFEFKSPFQSKLAEYLSEEYMNYINSQNLVADGKKLTIQYDLAKHPETNGYYGTYLDYMEKQAESDLDWYLNNLEWSDSWTKNDPTMSDQEAFLKGAYTSTDSGRGGGPPGMMVASGAPGGAAAGTVGAEGTGAAGAGAIDDAAAGETGEMGGNMGGGPPGMGGGDTAGKGSSAAGLIGDVEVSTSDASSGPGGMGGGMPGGDMGAMGGPGGDMGGPPGMGGSSSAGTPTPGVDITSWVKYEVNKGGTYKVDFDLADFLNYRGAKMNKPVPGYDTITYSQEVWVFGNAEKDGRHFSVFVNNVFSDPEKAAVLKPLYSMTDSNVFLDADGNVDFDAMVAAHKAEYADIAKGDKYGNNIVELYNPVQYIGAEGTEDPTWSRIMMGGVEGDIALLCSMNIAIKWQMAGVENVTLQWQWNGGHVPSDIFSMSFEGYVDENVK